MNYIFTFKHKNIYIELFEYKGVLLFPNAGISLFPRNEGIKKITNEKIIFNIKLINGLTRKNIEKINNNKSHDDII